MYIYIYISVYIYTPSSLSCSCAVLILETRSTPPSVLLSDRQYRKVNDTWCNDLGAGHAVRNHRDFWMCAQARKYKRTHVQTHARMHSQHMHVYTHMHAHEHTHTHTHARIFVLTTLVEETLCIHVGGTAIKHISKTWDTS